MAAWTGERTTTDSAEREQLASCDFVSCVDVLSLLSGTVGRAWVIVIESERREARQAVVWLGRLAWAWASRARSRVPARFTI